VDDDAVMVASYADVPVRVFLARLGGDEPLPAGGTAAGVTVAIAAGLVELSARRSQRVVADADDLVERAGGLRALAVRLADEDARAYSRVIGASGEERDAALAAAADVPLAIAEVAVEVARIGLRLAREGTVRIRSDAAAAVELGHAVVHACVGFVVADVSSADDARAVRARTFEAEVETVVDELRRD
jgi:methenyltetrahydrofolate cyclohydrolase